MPHSSCPISETLESHFGFRAFLPGQKAIIEDIVSKKSVIIVRPTGAGKSLCFQLPSLLMPGLSLVVSPLIALMNEQVEALCELGISAAFLNSGQSRSRQREVEAKINDDDLQILYVAPERFASQRFRTLIKAKTISILAIDEAHCISEWGHDFRPEYRQLKAAIDTLKPSAVVACTATATTTVIEDIEASLGLQHATRHVSGFLRENLHLSVMRLESESARQKALVTLLAKQASKAGKTIVYCATRKSAISGAQFVKMARPKLGLSVYHAGLGEFERTRRQHAFRSGEIKILFATTAFGLGVNLPDIRLVVHLDTPRSIAQYYQEVGRAGRDGEPAGAVLLFRAKDLGLQRFLLEVNNPNKLEAEVLYKYVRQAKGLGRSFGEMQTYVKAHGIRTLMATVRLLMHHGILYENNVGHLCAYEAAPSSLVNAGFNWQAIARQKTHAIEQLEDMRILTQGEQCLHETVLAHFGDHSTLVDCPSCSKCLSREKTAFTEGPFAQVIEDFVNEASGYYSLEEGAKILSGATSLSTGASFSTARGQESLSFMPTRDVALLISALVREGILQYEGDDAARLRLGHNAKTLSVTRGDSAEGLRAELESFRDKQALSRSENARQLMPDSVVERLVFSKPRTKMAFLAVKGLGPKRWKCYGQALLALFESLSSHRETEPWSVPTRKGTRDEPRAISSETSTITQPD